MAEDFFVGIYDPVDVRRNILESSKELIKSLQLAESLENKRKKKLLLFGKMRKIMKELDTLVRKLDEKLPKSKLDEVKTEKGKGTTKTKVSSELDKLDKQLKDIEKELSSLK